MSDFDTARTYFDLSSDEGPAWDDGISVSAWEAVKDDVRAWLVRPC
jgi:hypothetical protein